MSENIFDATLDPNNDVRVNNFDWSHANNLTTQIGRITPIFCDVVPAKSSFRVNPNFGLQFMPMVFPIQSRLKARISFFRYPLRALWKDYKDFIGNFREGLEEPFIDFNSSRKIQAMASTGSLGDYLGLPSTSVGRFGTSISFSKFDGWLNFDSDLIIKNGSSRRGVITFDYIRSRVGDIFLKDITKSHPTPSGSSGSLQNGSSLFGLQYAMSGPVNFEKDESYSFNFKLNFGVSERLDSKLQDYSLAKKFLTGSHFLILVNSSDQIVYAERVSSISNIEPRSIQGSYDISYNFETSRMSDNFSAVKFIFGFFPDSDAATFGVHSLISAANMISSFSKISSDINEIDLDTSPWYNSSSAFKDKQQKILAYSFRAYEGIYNSYFRDNRNNPYYLDGRVQYNTWIPSDAGGADDNLYELRYANWEKDFLTTAVQSPQQGNAPLVGITTYTQTVTDENGNKKELIKTSLVDEDGKKYGLSFTQNEDGLAGVEYVELDNGTAVRQARSLYDLATSGISIPDLRMVNCYQKFLELNMRKGYSYKDIIEGRFDVKVRYADLLLPEFFGGVSRDIDVNAVTQTVDQNVGKGSSGYAGSLGSQSGLAGVRGSSNANIECFCDEESVIIGLLVVTPIPVYTQLLPKHFTYRGLMEHYQPEFNLIGFQPIKYNEVCPIQAFNSPDTSLFDTFGYNRPWYEYVQKYDSAHGLFRTSLSNFLMHRVFDRRPELAQSFLVIDPDQVTDVFSVTETTDKIYGQIWLDITAKLPIARVAIPRLD